jgi:hypothetical protein
MILKWLTRFRTQRAHRGMTRSHDRLVDLYFEQIEVWDKAFREVSAKEEKNLIAEASLGAHIFVKIALSEFYVLFKHLETADRYWEKVVFAKFFALSLYEFYNDFPSVYGSYYRRALAVYDFDGQLKQELNAIVKGINELKAEAFEKLQEIRNTVAGHKDHSPFKQLDIIRSIDIDWLSAHWIMLQLLMQGLTRFEKRLDEIKRKRLEAGSG